MSKKKQKLKIKNKKLYKKTEVKKLIKNRMIYDYVFKKVFRSKTSEGEYILKGFLETVLDFPVEKIEFINSELDSVKFGGKDIRLDLLVIVNESLIVNVEMQISGTIQRIGDRLIYYGVTILSKQLEKGIDYSGMMPLLQIVVMGENKYKDKDQIRFFQTADLEHGLVLTDKWKISIIELMKSLTNVQDYCTLTKLQQWMIFMLEYTVDTTDKRLLEMIENDKYMREAAMVMKEIFNDLEGLRYALNEGSVIKDKLQIRNEGKAEGIVEGKAEGKAENSIDIAKKLIDAGLDNNFITYATGITVDQINQLRVE